MFERSCWIGPTWQVDCGGEENRYYAFRKAVEVPQAPKAARVCVTADARYVLWVNGRFVGRGPARCFPEHQSYDEYDIAEFLRPGVNWIAALVHQFGRSTGQYIYRYRTGLLLEGEIRAGKSVVPLQTDLTWRVREADWYLRTHARLSQHMGFQERYDAAREPADWRCPADAEAAAKDPAWRTPFYVGPACSPPWSNFEPRGLPPMAEMIVRPERITWVGTGQNGENVHTADNLLEVWRRDQPTPIDAVPAIDADGWMTLDPRGQGFAAVAFDFGWCHAAYSRIEVRGAHGGEIIDSYYAHGLQPASREPELSAGFGTANEGLADRFIAGPGESSFETYSIRGYRQHIVVVRTDHPLSVRVTARRTHHPFQPRGKFRCNDDTVNAVWAVSDRTIRAGTLDAFVDNNSREQVQWLHDGAVIGLGAWATYGDTAVWRRGLRQWGQSQAQYPSGCLNGMAPTEPTFAGISDYSFAWVHSLWQYYEITADAELLREMADVVDRMVRDFIEPNITADGLFISPEGHWMFIDWSELDLSPYSATLNVMLLQAIASGAKVAAVARSSALAIRCRRLEKRLRSAIEKRFWSARHGAWLEHAEPSAAVRRAFAKRLEKQESCPWNRGWPSTEPLVPCGRQANAIAILLGLGTVKQQAGAAKLLAGSFTPDAIAKNSLSPMFLDRIFAALCAMGHDDVMIDVLRNHHGRWIANGATAWGELWGADAATHAQTYGAGVNWALTSFILGVRATKPGFAEIVFDPRPGPLTWAEGVVPTVRGDIHVSWRRSDDGTIERKIRAPRGVKVRK